ncbi:MAG: lactate racemase domain-containing protein [Planctomycetota bacterium]|nr:lactate racemase domain-containing protein [Planctomycetota bacterium]
MTILGKGAPDMRLSDRTVESLIAEAAEALAPDGRRILVLIPDHTRSCPLPLIVRSLHANLARRAAKLDFLIALGTHPPLSEEQIDTLLGIEPGCRDDVLPGSDVFNHDWRDPGALATVGTLAGDRIREITGGRFAMEVPVTLNRRVFEYDLVLVAGPVFPHEVAGFSGGAKYFFPGICGADLLNFFHWLGAVISIPKIIGIKDTAVRATLEAAMDLVAVEVRGLCMVVRGQDLLGLYFGPLREAWSEAATLSDQVHVVYCDKPYQSILSCAPAMYDDLWVGAKCMYKLECVVADGGELIIYAPHIRQVSVTHGRIIEEIGYHTLAYFLAQWGRFKNHPWGVLAHSTHVRGLGTYENGVERPRVRVTLATGIPESLCRKMNLEYRNPASIDPRQWQGRESRGRLYVPKAGETLYRLKEPPEWAKV